SCRASRTTLEATVEEDVVALHFVGANVGRRSRHAWIRVRSNHKLRATLISGETGVVVARAERGTLAHQCVGERGSAVVAQRAEQRAACRHRRWPKCPRRGTDDAVVACEIHGKVSAI